MSSRTHYLSGVLIAVRMLTAPVVLAQSDTMAISRAPLFTRTDALWAGVAILGTLAVMPFDERIARNAQHRGIHPPGFVADVDSLFRLTAVPGALVIGGSMYAIGRVGRWKRVADLGLHGTEAVLVGSAVGGIVKGTLGRARPYVVDDSDAFDFSFGRGFRKGTDYSSLPSGHTTAAFAAAAAVTAETAQWWPHSKFLIGTAMYGGATMVAVSRMYDNKHWASDVALAGLIGTLSGNKVVRYHHSHPGNRIDRWLLATSVVLGPRGSATVAWSLSRQ